MAPEKIDYHQEQQNNQKESNIEKQYNLKKEKNLFLSTFWQKLEKVNLSKEYNEYILFVEDINSWKDPEFTRDMKHNIFGSLHYLTNWEITEKNIWYIIHEYIPIFVEALWWNWDKNKIMLWSIEFDLDKFSKNSTKKEKSIFFYYIIRIIETNFNWRHKLEFKNWYNLDKIKSDIIPLFLEENSSDNEKSNLPFENKKTDPEYIRLSKKAELLRLNLALLEKKILIEDIKKDLEKIWKNKNNLIGPQQIDTLKIDTALLELELHNQEEASDSIDFINFSIFTKKAEVNEKINEISRINPHQEQTNLEYSLNDEEWESRYSFIWEWYINSDQYREENREMIYKFTIMYYSR